MNKINKGILFALFTAIISGFSIFYNKLVVVKGVDATIFNIIKNGGVGIIFTLWLVSSKKIITIPKLSKGVQLKLLLIAGIGGSIPFVLFFEGLKLIPAINATIIQKSLFLWVSLMALPFLKEKIKLPHLLAYALIAWSNLLIGGFAGFTFGFGEQLILLATLLWSVEIIVTKKVLSSVDNEIVSWARMAGGTLFLLAIAAFQGKLPLLTHVSQTQLLLSVGSILFLSGYVFFWHKALKIAPATLVTSVLILATPITNILSTLFITHVFPSANVLNLVGSMLGVGIILIIDHSQKQTSQILVA